MDTATKKDQLLALAEYMLEIKQPSYLRIEKDKPSKHRNVARFAVKELTKRCQKFKFDIYQSERRYLNSKIFFVILLSQTHPISKK